MKSTAFKTIALIILLPFVAVGCADMSPTLKGGAIGAGVGAATGAAAGAIIDGGSGAGKGAGVGAVVGLVSGLIAGEMYSQSQKQRQEANAPRLPSESYSTTLQSPTPKTQGEPLLLVNEATTSDRVLADYAMSFMGDMLTVRGIKYEQYTISAAAKNQNAPVVVLKSVKRLGSPNKHEGYEVVLSLVRKDVAPKEYSASAPTLVDALSQALFGK